MKFFVRVFLLILSPFSLIKIVLSLKCETFTAPKDLYPDCMADMVYQDTDDKLLSKIFSCLRKGLDKKKGEPCSGEKTKCLTTTFELKDQTEYILKSCDDSNGVMCDNITSLFLQRSALWSFIQASHCDYCASDNCDDKIPKDKPLLPPPTEKPTPPPRESRDKFSVSAPPPRESTDKLSVSAPPPTESRDRLSISAHPLREQKHSASLSAVSAPPVTALFIVISIIHILL